MTQNIRIKATIEYEWEEKENYWPFDKDKETFVEYYKNFISDTLPESELKFMDYLVFEVMGLEAPVKITVAIDGTDYSHTFHGKDMPE
jgi:hypothetical protein